MKMKHSRFAVLFLSILVPVSIFFASCQGRSAASGGKTSASIVYLEGRVTQDGKDLVLGDAIADGSLIQTDPDGLAEIVFEGKNALRIGPSASLRVHLSDLEKSVDVERGKVTAVLRKLNKLSGGKMDVRTPSLVAGIRGTSFCVWVSGTEEETYFCTCNGKIEFTPGGTDQSIIEEASHHEALVFTGSGDNVSYIPAPPDRDPRHSDKDLETLAARIGETMDWTHVEE